MELHRLNAFFLVILYVLKYGLIMLLSMGNDLINKNTWGPSYYQILSYTNQPRKMWDKTIGFGRFNFLSKKYFGILGNILVSFLAESLMRTSIPLSSHLKLSVK